MGTFTLLSQGIAAVSSQVSKLKDDLDDVVERAASTDAKVRSHSSSMSEAASAAVASVRSSVGEAQAAVEEGERTSTEGLSRLERRAQETRKEVTTVLDGIRESVVDNDWGQEFQAQLDLVMLGGQSVADLIAKYGDAKVGAETLRELLDGIDYRVYERDINALVRDLTTGAASVDDAVKKLSKNNAIIAQQLLKMIELFRAGKVGIEQVASTVEAIKRQFSGTDLANLAQAIENALRQEGPG